MTIGEVIEWLDRIKDKYIHGGDEGFDNKRKEAIDMAIESLQREIPKNPVVNYVADSDGARRLNDGWTEDSYVCPVCYTYFGTVYDEGYCRKCGQKLIQKRVRVIEP